MLLHILSDVHLEHYQYPSAIKKLEELCPTEVADVLVLAGDIFSLKSGSMWAYFDEFKKWAVDVVFVPGNHEYYGMSFREAKARLQTLYADEGIRVLGPEFPVFEAKGFKFVGTTLWYPDNPSVRVCLSNWTDAAYIGGFMHHWPSLQLKEREYLWENVDDKTVVVTHMLPTFRAISPMWEGFSSNPMFVSPMDELITEKRPPLWVHGHSHEVIDLTIEGTRLIRNVIGYPREGLNGSVLTLEI